MKRVVVLDYGSGNLRSAERALARAGVEVEVSGDAAAAAAADGLVVPGVGAFAACMAGIAALDIASIVAKRVAAQAPVLGICVGMQVLFDAGVEHGIETAGLGVLPGRVELLQAAVLPHMGWNTVLAPAGTALFAGVDPTSRFYFVHSYALRVGAIRAGSLDAAHVATTHHGEDFVAAIEQGPVSATQFHPEKSGDVGAAVLENWCKTL
jgi:glutamine amidotransferase